MVGSSEAETVEPDDALEAGKQHLGSLLLSST
jgi:hypothetical protein